MLGALPHRRRTASAADRRPYPPPFTATLSNNTPLAFRHGCARGRTRAWRAAQLYQRPPGQRGLPRLPQSRRQRIVSTRSDRLYLQFRKGRLAGWKGDWGITGCGNSQPAFPRHHSTRAFRCPTSHLKTKQSDSRSTSIPAHSTAFTATSGQATTRPAPTSPGHAALDFFCQASEEVRRESRLDKISKTTPCTVEWARACRRRRDLFRTSVRRPAPYRRG